jgi:benzoyl-CoA reductase/2-hydroxyglutaryl-CoA dehydratase subunit BcrC/BadD/HgdB
MYVGETTCDGKKKAYEILGEDVPMYVMDVPQMKREKDILKWKDDPSITVTVISDRKVSYNGEEVSISALSAQLKGYKVKHIQPTPHWTYNERLLSEIYDETYPFEE